MRSTRFSLLLALGLTAAGCSVFHRGKPAPAAEAVRTPDSPTPPTAARDLADVMGANLQLTPDQTGRIRTILSGTVAQANAAKSRFPPKSAPLVTELKRINTDSQKELRLVMGPAKFKQLQTKGTQQKIAAEMHQRQK